jgi:ubiquinone/menaquinone biosynthesis C-methylase UbiE
LDWNIYYNLNLTNKEIKRGDYKSKVGGEWESLGRLQLDFLQKKGLLPNHQLLDIGCGSLRAGIHLINYLQPSHYCGIDISSSLLKAGRLEVKKANLKGKKPNLLTNDRFEFEKFNKTFEYAIAHSLFTHLPINVIHRCLVNCEKVLKEDGKLYATFFETKEKCDLKPIRQSSGIITHTDKDPYHYHLSVFEYLAKGLSLEVEYIGDWGHTKNQKMLCFTKMR